MYENCTTGVTDDLIVTIRSSFVKICGDYRTAALLSYFVDDYNLKMEAKKQDVNQLREFPCPLPHKSGYIKKQLLGILSKKSLFDSRKRLINLGFLTEHRNPKPKMCFDSTVHFLLHPEEINDCLNNLKTDI